MRKFEQVKDIETIKKMAIAGFKIEFESFLIVKANSNSFVYEIKGEYFVRYWSGVVSDSFKILPPEITLEEARERIKSGVVYAKDCRNGQYAKIYHFTEDGSGWTPVFTYYDPILYPFDPSQFADLLEEVEGEKADERPVIDHFTGNYEDDSNYVNGHFERIYSELDQLNFQTENLLSGQNEIWKRIEALEHENNELTENNHKLLCGFDMLAQRIAKLEGKN